jgi:hypothetical protein
MKCYTVTEKGVTPGISISSDPYPHVGIGDPNAEPDFRRVEIDETLAGNVSNDYVSACSIQLEHKEEDKRRSAYKLINTTGKDDDQALVKFEVSQKGRTSYEFPRNTFTLAKGWHSKDGGPRVTTPVELVALRKGNNVRVFVTTDSKKESDLLFTISFDGNEVKKQ